MDYYGNLAKPVETTEVGGAGVAKLAYYSWRLLDSQAQARSAARGPAAAAQRSPPAAVVQRSPLVGSACDTRTHRLCDKLYHFCEQAYVEGSKGLRIRDEQGALWGSTNRYEESSGVYYR